MGIAISFATQTHHHQDEFLGGISDMGDNVTRGAGITVGTTLLGAVIGWTIGSEQWQDVNRVNWSTSLRSGKNGDYGVVVSYSF
jgi:outer membrane lipoprotein SlyB